jgi:hypothetical protein
MVFELVQEDMNRVAPAGPHREAASHFVAGAFCEMLGWWLDSPKRTWTMQDLETHFFALVRPVMKQIAQH